MKAAPTVSFRAATDCGLVTASRKTCLPSLREAQTRAAIGSITIRVK